MLKLKLKSPRYPYWVQIKSKDELGLHTLNFLNQHATRPWAEITVQDINDFLVSCYAQAQWAGEAYNSQIKAPQSLVDQISYFGYNSSTLVKRSPQ